MTTIRLPDGQILPLEHVAWLIRLPDGTPYAIALAHGKHGDITEPEHAYAALGIAPAVYRDGWTATPTTIQTAWDTLAHR